MAVDFDTIPVQDAIPAKRGPGRPRLTDEQREAKNARDRARRAAGGTRRKPTRRKASPRGPKSLAPELAAMLTMANMLVVMSPLGTRPIEAMDNPSIAPERVGDELDGAEIAALADAVDAQCRRSPQFRKWVERFLTAGSGGQLISVLGIIATRRAARHGLAPAHLDPVLGMMLASDGVSALGQFVHADEPTDAPDPTTGEVAPERFDFDADAAAE